MTIPPKLVRQCTRLFPDELGDEPETTSITELESLRQQFMDVIWAEKRKDHRGMLGDWPWRITPPTRQTAIDSIDMMNEAVDVLELRANQFGASSSRHIDITPVDGVRVLFPAGTNREDVIAGLVDALHAVQTDWAGILRPAHMYFEDWDDEEAKALKEYAAAGDAPKGGR